MKAPGVNTGGPAGVNTGLLRASRVGCTWRPTRAKRQSQTGSSALSLPPLPLLLEVVEPKHKVLGEPRAHVDQVHLRLQTQKAHGWEKERRRPCRRSPPSAFAYRATRTRGPNRLVCCGAHAAGAVATPPAAAAPAAAVPAAAAAAAPSATASGWRKLVWRCSQPSSSAVRPPVHGSSREEAPLTATVRCGVRFLCRPRRRARRRGGRHRELAG